MRLQKELHVAIELARQAGKILLDNCEHPPGVRRKEDADKTFVTDIDTAISDMITKELTEKFPDYAILDEERKEDGRRFSAEYCWIIDPLDSTRSYVNKQPEFGVIIGLIYNYKPVLGVTYKPLKDELLYAVNGNGAYIENNGKKDQIYVSPSTDINVLVSTSRTSNELDELIRRINPVTIGEMAGSLKIVEVAKGNATLFLCPSTSVLRLWDVCGPSVILQEAGGKLTDLSGNLIDYSQKEPALRKGIIASTTSVHKKILNAISLSES